MLTELPLVQYLDIVGANNVDCLQVPYPDIDFLSSLIIVRIMEESAMAHLVQCTCCKLAYGGAGAQPIMRDTKIIKTEGFLGPDLAMSKCGNSSIGISQMSRELHNAKTDRQGRALGVPKGRGSCSLTLCWMLELNFHRSAICKEGLFS